MAIWCDSFSKAGRRGALAIRRMPSERSGWGLLIGSTVIDPALRKANDDGLYGNQEPELQPEFNLRGRYRSGGDGAWDLLMAGVEIICGAGPVRAVCVLVHGRGQVPADMVRMVVEHVGLSGIRWVMPGADGKSWYKAKAVDPLTPETRASMDDGFATFDALLAAERAAYPGVPMAAAGFSQGACMVAEWVLRGAKVEALAVFTGCRVGAFDAGEAVRALDGLPVYASCGDQDSWIPLSAFQRLCAVLGDAGARLRTDVLPGRPHDISPAEVAEFARILEALAERGPGMAEGIA
jgi:phospholipase/carboxylesterase